MCPDAPTPPSFPPSPPPVAFRSLPLPQAFSPMLPSVCLNSLLRRQLREMRILNLSRGHTAATGLDRPTPTPWCDQYLKIKTQLTSAILIKKIFAMTHADRASHALCPQYFRHTTFSLLSGDQPSQGNDWPQVQSALKASMAAGQVIKTERALHLRAGGGWRGPCRLERTLGE